MGAGGAMMAPIMASSEETSSPIETTGTLPASPRPRRAVVGAWVLGALVVLTVGAFFTNRALYRQSFARLVEATQTAERAPVWVDYFVAEDCLFATVVDRGDPEAVYREALSVLDQTDLLAAHVRSSLSVFAGLSFLPTQRPLAGARDAIVGHYRVWGDHLASIQPVLSGLSANRGGLGPTLGAWIEEVAGASEEIRTTFEAAEAALVAAAHDDPARQEVDRLFTPSEAQCSRGAV